VAQTNRNSLSRFNGLCSKPLKWFSAFGCFTATWLKPGVNEIGVHLMC